MLSIQQAYFNLSLNLPINITTSWMKSVGFGNLWSSAIDICEISECNLLECHQLASFPLDNFRSSQFNMLKIGNLLPLSLSPYNNNFPKRIQEADWISYVLFDQVLCIFRPLR